MVWVEITAGKDLYHKGELLQVDEVMARQWIKAGVAKVRDDICPSCGSGIAHEGSCVSCYSCGWSACG